jgi:hypothetical protein
MTGNKGSKDRRCERIYKKRKEKDKTKYQSEIVMIIGKRKRGFREKETTL